MPRELLLGCWRPEPPPYWVVGRKAFDPDGVTIVFVALYGTWTPGKKDTLHKLRRTFRTVVPQNYRVPRSAGAPK